MRRDFGYVEVDVEKNEAGAKRRAKASNAQICQPCEVQRPG